MHYLALVAVEIPEIEEDYGINALIESELSKVEQTLKEGGDSLIGQEVRWEMLNNLRTTFSRAVRKAVMDQMAPYSAETEDQEYLEFWDQTDRIMESYQESYDCLKLPQGKIIPVYGHPNYGRFVIRDGHVFETNAGSLYHEKRTKRAKRIKALPDYPVKKRYPDMRYFAEHVLGMRFDEEEQAYGYYVNPNAMWDWFSVGGRWPYMMLVKKSCKEYAVGEISWAHKREIPKAPEDYQWVCAARKKDIEWKVMRDWNQKALTERFRKIALFFQTGERPEGVYGIREENGIRYGNEYHYYSGETLEDYLKREDPFWDCKYPVAPHDLITQNGIWISSDSDLGNTDKIQKYSGTWEDQIENFLDNIPENDVLVAIDYHI